MQMWVEQLSNFDKEFIKLGIQGVFFVVVYFIAELLVDKFRKKDEWDE